MKGPLEDHMTDVQLQMAMLERLEQREEIHRRMEEELGRIDARFQKAKAEEPVAVQSQLEECYWRVRADYKAMMARDLGMLDGVLARWMNELGMDA